jgi:hypothetical protein
MVTKSDVEAVEKKLKGQLAKIRMAKKGLPADGSVVETQADVARHFNVRRSTVHDWVQKSDFPCRDAPYDLKRIEQWRQAQTDDAALLNSASDSPWLERWRKAKALQEDIRLEKLRGSVIEREQLVEALALLANVISRTGERLGAKFGPEAVGMMNDMLEDFEATIRREFNIQSDDDKGVGGHAGDVCKSGVGKGDSADSVMG